MNVYDVVTTLEAIAPPGGAEDWDNVGLLVGTGAWPVERAMLTIDLTDAVLDETIGEMSREASGGGREAARGEGASMIIAYHPPIFAPLRALTDATSAQRIALECAQASIAVYSPHTALDAATGGVNDWLAEALGPGDVRALESIKTLPSSEERKIVTFCPAESVDLLRNALATAGAGRIGEYELCSFELAGTGTFIAGPAAAPTVGAKGVLERVDEVRLEMVCPTAALGLVVLALREFHPYEEPPIEIYSLQPRPQRSAGAGRRVVPDQPVDVATLVARLKTHLGVSTLRVATAPGAPRRHGMIGLCAGAGGSMLDNAIAQGCTLFLTGEMRHHDVLAAQARGCTVILAGHTNTERGYLKRLRKTLTTRLPGLKVSVSRRDRDPLKVV